MLAWPGLWVWTLASPTLPAPACPVTQDPSISRSEHMCKVARSALVWLPFVGVPTIPRAIGGSTLLLTPCLLGHLGH